ncbi:Adenylate cyclase type 10 [Hondaea fermentalgiana]|uniref:Adenylate cyclase type 10 n=1 Tax=Hondaea fermentalgiana TaxID=2315210 RepID=A0A2R5G294_9STRA|nr:Adenylate cyclase type 10 [Hondaea fermentalgiana]|eukprot:GBG25136.1 Adenylate cyclase type 10 [Hondaea fermentalgiana]
MGHITSHDIASHRIASHRITAPARIHACMHAMPPSRTSVEVEAVHREPASSRAAAACLGTESMCTREVKVDAAEVEQRARQSYLESNEANLEEIPGVVAFFDISGFSSLANELKIEEQRETQNQVLSAGIPRLPTQFTVGSSASKIGPLAPSSERLAEILNHTLSGLVNYILMSGGDIIKFAGDALIAIWRSSMQEVGSMAAVACHTALKCTALTSESNAGLQLHTGIGCGQLILGHVGGQLDRWEFFIAGDANTQAALAQEASKRDQVVVSSTVMKKLGTLMDLKPTPIEIELFPQLGHPGYFQIRMVKLLHGNYKFPDKINLAAESMLPMETRILGLATAYIPRPVTKMIENRSANVDEIRKVSVIFFHLLEPLNSPPPREGLLRKYSSASLTDTLEHESMPSSPQHVGISATLPSQENAGESPRNEEPPPLSAAGLLQPPPLALGGTRRLGGKRVDLSVDTSSINGDDNMDFGAASGHTAGDGAHSERQQALDMFLDSIHERVKAVQRAAYSQWGTLRQFIIDDKGCVAIVVMGLPPHYFEDNAARAVKIAANLIHSQGVQASAGICTGTVFCGAIGSEYRAEYSVTGECINLAARLMGKAEPNSALCDAQTYKEAKSNHNFTFSKVSHTLKGYNESVTAYAPGLAAIAEKKTLKQGHLGGGMRASPNQGSMSGQDWVTIGQEQAKADLCRAAFLDRIRPSKAVLLQGPPGAGKSHLLSWVSNVADRKTVDIFYNVAEVSERKTPFSVWKAIVQEMLKFKPKEIDPASQDAADRDSNLKKVLTANRHSTLSSVMAIMSPSEAASAAENLGEHHPLPLESPMITPSGSGPGPSAMPFSSPYISSVSRTSSVSSIRRTGMRGLFGSSAAAAAAASPEDGPDYEWDISNLQTLTGGGAGGGSSSAVGTPVSGPMLVRRGGSNFMAIRSSASADVAHSHVERRRLSSKSRSTPRPLTSTRSFSFNGTDEDRAALAHAIASPNHRPLSLNSPTGGYANAAATGNAPGTPSAGPLAKISHTVGQVGQVLQRSLSMDVTARRIRKKSPIPSHTTTLSADAGIPGASGFPEPLALGQSSNLGAAPALSMASARLSSLSSPAISLDAGQESVGLDERFQTRVLNSYSENPQEEEEEDEDGNEEGQDKDQNDEAKETPRMRADMSDAGDDDYSGDHMSEGGHSMVFVQRSHEGSRRKGSAAEHSLAEGSGGEDSRFGSPGSTRSSINEPGPVNQAAPSPWNTLYDDFPMSASCNNMEEFMYSGDNEIDHPEPIYRTTSMGRPASMPRSLGRNALPLQSPRVRTGSGHYSGIHASGAAPSASTTGSRFLQMSAQSGDHKLLEGSPMLARLRDNGHLRGRRLSSLGHLLPGFVFASADGGAPSSGMTAAPTSGAAPHPLARTPSTDRSSAGTAGDEDGGASTHTASVSGQTTTSHRKRVLSDSSESGLFNSLLHSARPGMFRRSSPTPTPTPPASHPLSPTGRLTHRFSDADLEARSLRSPNENVVEASRGLHGRRGSGTLRAADREDIIEIVLALLDEIGKRGPVVIIIDDAQHLDDASWELLKRAVLHGMDVTAQLQEEVIGVNVKSNTTRRAMPGPSVRFIVAYRTMQETEQLNPHWLELLELCQCESQRVARAQGRREHAADESTDNLMDEEDNDLEEGSLGSAAPMNNSLAPSRLGATQENSVIMTAGNGMAESSAAHSREEHEGLVRNEAGTAHSQELSTMHQAGKPGSTGEQSSDDSVSLDNEHDEDGTKEGKSLRPAWCLVSYTEPLSQRDAANFLTSNRAVGVGSDLLEFLHDSTKGNPGSMLNLFSSLVERGFIRINSLTGMAQVMDGLRNMAPENLLLMSLPAHFVAEVYGRWDNLSTNVLLILKMASVIGKVVLVELLFDVYTKKNQLMRVASTEPSSTAAMVQQEQQQQMQLGGGGQHGLLSPVGGIQGGLRREDSIAELPPQASDASAEFAAAAGTAVQETRPHVARSMTDRPSIGERARSSRRASVNTPYGRDSITLVQDTSEQLILLAGRSQSDNGLRRKTSRFFSRHMSRKLSAKSSSGSNEGTNGEGPVRRLSTSGSLQSLDPMQKAALRAEFFEGIEELKRVGFLSEQTTGETLSFKEDAERSIVYDLMPNKEKRLIHQYILEWYEEDSERIDVAFPTGYDIGTLGYHAMLAEEHLKAFSYFEAGIGDLSSHQGIVGAELEETFEALSFSLKDIASSEILARQLSEQTRSASVEILKRFFRCRALTALCRFYVMRRQWVEARACAKTTAQTCRFARVALQKRETTLKKLIRRMRSLGASRAARDGNWMRRNLATVNDETVLRETVKCGDQARRLLQRIAAMNEKVDAMIRNIDDMSVQMI